MSSGHDPLHSALWLSKKLKYRRNPYSSLADEVFVAKRNNNSSTPTTNHNNISNNNIRSLTTILKAYSKLGVRQKLQLFTMKDNNYQSMKAEDDKAYNCQPLSPVRHHPVDPLEGVEVCIPTSPTSTFDLHLIIPALGKPELRSRESSTSLCSTQNSTLEDPSEIMFFHFEDFFNNNDQESFFTFTRDDMPPPKHDVEVLDEGELLGLQFLEETEDDEIFSDNISVLTPGSF